jgi:anti-sigma28 factor (negative regulator of flagellin synthesis)
MDPLDNPRFVKRPTVDPAHPASEAENREAQESDSQPSGSETLIDAARREKIESLKKAVADGTYNISAEEVARKVIDHMLEPKE